MPPLCSRSFCEERCFEWPGATIRRLPACFGRPPSIVMADEDGLVSSTGTQAIRLDEARKNEPGTVRHDRRIEVMRAALATVPDQLEIMRA